MRWVLFITAFTLSSLTAKEALQTRMCNAWPPKDPLKVEHMLSAEPEMEELAGEVLLEVNKFRAKHGKAPLDDHSAIAEQSQNHSDNMAKGIVPFSHDGVHERFKNLKAAIPSLRNCGENCFYVSGRFFFGTLAQFAVQGWSRSPGHRRNMLNDFNLTGIGVAKDNKGGYYFTQMFVKAK